MAHSVNYFPIRYEEHTTTAYDYSTVKFSYVDSCY